MYKGPANSTSEVLKSHESSSTFHSFSEPGAHRLYTWGWRAGGWGGGKTGTDFLETSPFTNRKQSQQLTQFQDTYLDTGHVESYSFSGLARRSLEHSLKSHLFFPFFFFLINHSLNSYNITVLLEL